MSSVLAIDKNSNEIKKRTYKKEHWKKMSIRMHKADFIWIFSNEKLQEVTEIW